MAGYFPPWTDVEIAHLRALAAMRYTSNQIARALGKQRSPSGVRVRAHKLGITLSNPRWGAIPRLADTTLWSEADRISEWARVPQGLANLLAARAEEYGQSLKAIRSESRVPDLVKFRRRFSREAATLGYAYSEIGRALNRDHTTIIHHVRAA